MKTANYFRSVKEVVRFINHTPAGNPGGGTGRKRFFSIRGEEELITRSEPKPNQKRRIEGE
jgi:hypothetical protein